MPLTITTPDEGKTLEIAATGDLKEVLGQLSFIQGVQAVLNPPLPGAPPPADLSKLILGIHTDGALRIPLVGGRELKITAEVSGAG